MSRWLAIVALVWVGCTKSDECTTVENACEASLGRPVEPGDACVELAYDGRDQDCDGNDWVDIDGDGVPSMTVTQYEQATGKPWPDGVDPVREVPLVDCDDFKANIHPGANEGLDDSVDSNCDGLDDKDLDGDGYEPGIVDVDCLPDANPPCGDCDDTNKDVRPGASPDVWYDGVDTNCDGANDFDQDGDNYNPDQVLFDKDGDGTPELMAVMPEYNAYKLKYGYNYLGVGTGDCLDVTPTGSDVPPGLDAANVYPFAPDTPYDSIDADCARDDDFDGDRDGYQPDGAMSASAAYFTYWGYPVPEVFLDGDCDDANFDIHPNALEQLADTFDFDCDGHNDGAAFATRGYGWDDPNDVYIGKTAGRYAVTTTAAYADLGARKQKNGGIALYFDIDDTVAESDPHPTPDVPTPWWPAGRTGSSSHEISSSYASIYSADSLYMALSLKVAQDADTDVGVMVVRRAKDDGSELVLQSAESAGSLDVVEPFTDMDLVIGDDGWIWAWGCGDNTAGVLLSEVSKDTLVDRGEMSVAGTGVAADTAVIRPGASNDATAYCCASGVCQEFALTHDATSVTVESWTTSAEKYRAGHSGPEWRAFVGAPKGAIIEDRDGDSWTALSSRTLTDVAVANTSTTFFILGSTATELVLGYGARDSITEVAFPFSDGDASWTANKVGIYADNDRVILAASHNDGTSAGDATPDADDQVGWVFMGREGL